MRIAIDFDDTITRKGICPITGQVNPSAVAYIQQLKQAGHYLILYSGRRDNYLREAIEICRAHGIEFDEIAEKVIADIYIDDRAIRPEELF